MWYVAVTGTDETVYVVNCSGVTDAGDGIITPRASDAPQMLAALPAPEADGTVVVPGAYYVGPFDN